MEHLKSYRSKKMTLGSSRKLTLSRRLCWTLLAPAAVFLMITGLCGHWLVSVNAAQREPLPEGFRPGQSTGLEKLIPREKNFDPEWWASLSDRGRPQWFEGNGLRWIGLPIGGICAGQVYLGGDGRLWHWDIFNQPIRTGPEHYAHPLEPHYPLEQGFAVAVEGPSGSQIRPLDRRGFSRIRFRGEYPLGIVEYSDPQCPIAIRLEAFSPFIPLCPEDSALPLTVMEFTVENRHQEPVRCRIAGWLENAVCKSAGSARWGTRPIGQEGAWVGIEHYAEELPPAEAGQLRDDILFDDFERNTYTPWTVEGTAFGTGPVEREAIPAYQEDVAGLGQRVVNSHASAPGNTIAEKDSHTGSLTSPPFTIVRNFIHLWIGGGAHEGRTCVQLLVDGEVVASLTGANNNRMERRSFDVRAFAGRKAQLRILDLHSGGWGNIGVDHIVFSDRPLMPEVPLTDRPDFGTMSLAVVDSATQDVRQILEVLPGPLPEALFRNGPTRQSSGDTSPRVRPVAALVREMTLGAGERRTIRFVISWYFPNLRLDRLPPGRFYGTRFASAAEVAAYFVREQSRLCGLTRLWHDTWYDSTLPYWFLDRTFLNTSTLATSTCHWLANGRFYGWEGVGCCPGTCTHVWLYAQAVARIFPQLERSLRQMVDFGVAFDPETGQIRFRAEHNNDWAADGQAGCILRTYREHLMSPDDAFLRGLWPRVRKALEFLASRDENQDGILDGPQHNTLDAWWFGQVPWLSGMYLAALRAGEEMALRMDDPQFAARCRDRFLRGQKSIDDRLFNGEYYVHLPDPQHSDAIGSYNGCHIDQVLGQSWAWQVGLGRILDPDHVRSALSSLWRYNVTPDVGPYRTAFPAGRWYAMPGEGGVLMCTWPFAPVVRVQKSFDYYFNECMNGFEYQLAWHMIAEGMVLEGLAITRLVHDRYHPTKRNPYNEVECGDHYARSMASYGVFLSICGYEYDGPRGRIAFTPRLRPEHFRVAFTAAEGWGTFEQRIEGGQFSAKLLLRWGKLRLQQIGLSLPQKPPKVTLSVWLVTQKPEASGEHDRLPSGTDSGDSPEITTVRRKLPAEWTLDGGHAEIRFPNPILLTTDETLLVEIAP
jgi:uncharacterized protein (DUF608 family)